ncbi:MAG TPA: phytoene/squalene synthase family protein [Lysobacter sp.]|nr:phytoene/squalene synthase family protein [Lysobacter sp.]
MSAPDPRAPLDPALESFIDKWRGRWPEWPVAEIFVPPAQRALALAWATLLQELTDAAWGGRDARPGEAKLGWWQEELTGWAAGRRRHPLGQALQRQPATWARLAQALDTLPATREPARDAEQAIAALQAFAAAAAEAEQALFGGTGCAPAITLSLLHLHLAHHPDGAVPEALRAAHGENAPQAWAKALRRRFGARGTPRPRGVWAALAHARLAQADPAQPLSPWRTVWAAWRGARG